jgi:molybdenum cofactor cytidylyltransferase
MVERRRPFADVVLLAAGRSSRMGQPKGLVPFEGRPWIEAQLAALGPRRVIVVLGHDRERYRQAVPALAAETRVQVVVNPDPDRGAFSSLQLGLAAVSGAAFVLPVDVPAASPAVWDALEDALHGAIDAAVPRFEGRGGHPVLLARGFVAALCARSPVGPDSRLDRQLAAARASGRVTDVAVDDPRIRLNRNTPEDWPS